MSLENGTLSAADVAAVTGNNGLGWGDGSFWIIILFLFAFMGNGWGWNNGGNGGAAATFATQSDIQRGFDQTATMGALSGLSTALTNGFAQAEIANCDRLANLTAQMNNIAMAQQNCCCENRQQIADLKYLIATENAADRVDVANGVRDILENQNTKTQAILDKMCQMEMSAKDDRIAALQNQVTALQLAQSQTAQNGFFQNALNDAVRQLQPTPVPAYNAAALYPMYNNGLFTGSCGCNCNCSGM